MDAAFWNGEGAREVALPVGVEQVGDAEALAARRWTVLALTSRGCRNLPEKVCCETLLLPGDQGEVLERITVERVISVGLSPRDSLTFSSLTGPPAMLCIQRRLRRPDGREIEPGELPLPPLHRPPEEVLLTWGLRLLL